MCLSTLKLVLSFMFENIDICRQFHAVELHVHITNERKMLNAKTNFQFGNSREAIFYSMSDREVSQDRGVSIHVQHKVVMPS